MYYIRDTMQFSCNGLASMRKYIASISYDDGHVYSRYYDISCIATDAGSHIDSELCMDSKLICV